jgi:hypothetical protein
MTVREVREVALAWVREHAEGRPGFAGAHLGGSICRMSDDEPFPDISDVDLHIIIDGPVPDVFADVRSEMRQQKLLYRGVVLETIHDSLAGVTSAEDVLRSPLAAPAFASDCVLSDPTGALARVHEAVAADFARERWVRERCRYASELALWALAQCAQPRMLPGWGKTLFVQVGLFAQPALHGIASIPAIANLGGWTFRKCLVRCREVLDAWRRDDLYESILDLVGCRTLSPSRIEEHVEELSGAYDQACRKIRTPCYGDFEIQPTVRTIVFGGCADLVNQGCHREVVAYLLMVRNFVQVALWNDGSDEEKASTMTRYQGFLGDLGIDEHAFERRLERARALSVQLLAASEESLRSNPLIRH